uniref:Uncharacterized protein n=1 Tax=Plectus sambesii TaxID=2011161 RepID=A0A914XHZ6_9BILA
MNNTIRLLQDRREYGAYYCCLLGAGVLGHGLGAFRHGVLGELAGEDESDGGLHLAAGDGALLVVLGKTRRLGGDACETEDTGEPIPSGGESVLGARIYAIAS